LKASGDLYSFAPTGVIEYRSVAMAPLSGDYFSGGTWKERLDAWLNAQDPANVPFLTANMAAITRCLTHVESGLRMVVNISADALLGFLTSGRYLNAYNLPVVAGKQREPSPRRVRVDGLLKLKPPKNFYFGAAAMGGTGVRFYGEYCMVLRPTQIDDKTRVLDRNSYDLLYPPLSDRSDVDDLVKSLRGEWTADTVTMLARRILPEFVGASRLVTLGSVSDAILHDEDFLEVHKEGTFEPADLEEIRETPEDQAIQDYILSFYEHGGLPRIEELLWVLRRERIAQVLRTRSLRTRVVATAGRGSRWD
jgi:hypothetical protein